MVCKYSHKIVTVNQNRVWRRRGVAFRGVVFQGSANENKPGGGVKKDRRYGGISRSRLLRPNRNLIRQTIPAYTLNSAKVIVSNVAYTVTDDDIHDLFSVVGELKSSSVHYDSSGKSLGLAEVVYKNQMDAIKATRTYNGQLLDGRLLKVHLETIQEPETSHTSNIESKPGCSTKQSHGSPSNRFYGWPSNKSCDSPSYRSLGSPSDRRCDSSIDDPRGSPSDGSCDSPIDKSCGSSSDGYCDSPVDKSRESPSDRSYVSSSDSSCIVVYSKPAIHEDKKTTSTEDLHAELDDYYQSMIHVEFL